MLHACLHWKIGLGTVKYVAYLAHRDGIFPIFPKHWPAGPAHFSHRRTSSGQYISSFNGLHGPVKGMLGHQISNSAGPNDDKSQYVLFARAPAQHLGSFRADLLLCTARCQSESDLSIKHTDVSV